MLKQLREVDRIVQGCKIFTTFFWLAGTIDLQCGSEVSRFSIFVITDTWRKAMNIFFCTPGIRFA